MTLGNRAGLEAEELSDAVVLVDDVVAGAEVGERLERAAEVRGRAGGRFRKTCASGRRTRPSSRQTKPRRAGAIAKRSWGSRGSSSSGSSSRASIRRSMFCVRSASPRCGKATTSAGRTDEALELVLGLGEPSCRDRWTLRLEGEGLAGRKRLELGRAREREVVALELLRPDARRPLGLPDEVRDAGSGGTRSPGTGGGPSSSQCRLDQVESPLGRRVDGGLVDGPERALCEGRERPDAFDLVAEELDPQRLAAGRREDVDQPPRTANWPRSSTRSTRS